MYIYLQTRNKQNPKCRYTRLTQRPSTGCSPHTTPRYTHLSSLLSPSTSAITPFRINQLDNQHTRPSITRQTWRLLENGPIRSLLLFPMMIKSKSSPDPTFLASFSDPVPFLCAGGLALIFTTLLVLVDEVHSNDSKVVGR